jgi:hypothetical protein
VVVRANEGDREQTDKHKITVQGYRKVLYNDWINTSVITNCCKFLISTFKNVEFYCMQLTTQ